MSKGLVVARVDVRAERREDGTIILTNGLPLPPVSGTIHGRLAHWARERPDALFLTEGSRDLGYGEAERLRQHYAARLLRLSLSDTRPLMIIGNNGIDHALVMLAATSVGIPVAVVSPTYAAPGARPWTKLARVVTQVGPALILSDDPNATGEALAESDCRDAVVRPLRNLGWLDSIVPRDKADVAVAEALVGPDSIAKLLFTSGSTGQPKAVVNTQRMMVSNMLGLATIWPFLSERPPVSVDWLPWNHTFGGNCCFNIILWFGGHAHIDEGRPTPQLIARSVAAIRRWRPTLYFNVPIGFEMLLPILEEDADFARTFIASLDFVFNGGAPLPAALRARFEAIAMATAGRVPMIVAGWGSTETAPFSSVLYFPQPHANNLGAPMPGTAIKMVPTDGRYELRVRGPNVMPGYWRDPAATAAAFDPEGFYCIGDAGRFVDVANPSEGILFDGRVAENFKLTSGTWVNVAALRLAVVSAGERLISDAVVTGEGRGDIGLLIFPNEAACQAHLGPEAETTGVSTDPRIHTHVASLLQLYNEQQMGSSTRIARFVIMAEPLSGIDDEITDKGYINQRRVLDRRSALVDALYAKPAVL